MKHIASRDNPSFKALKKLCQSSREREKNNLAILDGLHLAESYVQHVGLPEKFVVSQTGLQRPEIARFLEKYTDGSTVQISVLTDVLFSELSEVETPSGLLVLIQYPQCLEKPDLQADTVLLEAIQDPGNLGTILRTSAAAGIRQVMLSADCAQLWSPKTLRAAMGAHFLLNLYEQADLSDFICHYNGMIALTTLNATHPLYALDLKTPVAWVFGNEGQGISPGLLQFMPKQARQVKIPMPGRTESLNVASAVAICLFEMVRQRL